MNAAKTPIVELRNVSKHFGSIVALSDISFEVHSGEVQCLLGDNGAGKSTLIKVISGMHTPSEGEVLVDGMTVRLNSPRDAFLQGIATVHQSTQGVPMMSIARNFFLGAEPTRKWGPFKRIDLAEAGRIALENLDRMGIRGLTSGSQLVGTLSGGERQALSICRAVYFGAKVLILDEPTSALGVKEAEFVLRLIKQARKDGVGVVFITHNAHHALAVGDSFTVLIKGEVAAKFRKGEKTRNEVLDLMAGGEEFEALALELDEKDEGL